MLPGGAAGGWARCPNLANVEFHRYVLIDFRQTISEGGTTMARTGAFGLCSTPGRT